MKKRKLTTLGRLRLANKYIKRLKEDREAEMTELDAYSHALLTLLNDDVEAAVTAIEEGRKAIRGHEFFGARWKIVSHACLTRNPRRGAYITGLTSPFLPDDDNRKPLQLTDYLKV